jgi:hypothetical protein
MNVGKLTRAARAGLGLACVLACVPMAAVAADTGAPSAFALSMSALGAEAQATGSEGTEPVLFPLARDEAATLDFDLAGSETRKLQLRLDQPLSFSAGSRLQTLDSGGALLGLDATLELPVTNRFSIGAGARQQTGVSRFQSLGSIQCMNGTLRADSYTASGCRFVTEPLASSRQRQFSLGAKMDFSDVSAGISWFDRRSEAEAPAVRRLSAGPAAPGLNLGSPLSPVLASPLPVSAGLDPLGYLDGEASGINLNFKVGIATDRVGDIRLGLAFTRVLDAEYQGLFAYGTDGLAWTLAEPVNTAGMNLEWSRGSFSTGVQGYYRDSVDFLNRTGIDSLATFDVHFTWRTPWNANLSVGASNVLSSGSESASGVESQPVDPFESVYGRIPYVRYKQDL